MKRLGKMDTRAKAFCDMVISEGHGEFSVIWLDETELRDFLRVLIPLREN